MTDYLGIFMMLVGSFLAWVNLREVKRTRASRAVMRQAEERYEAISADYERHCQTLSEAKETYEALVEEYRRHIVHAEHMVAEASRTSAQAVETTRQAQALIDQHAVGVKS